MTYLLDTCVLSEFTRRQPEERVIRWLDAVDEDKLYISAITIGEIQRGIAKLPSRGAKWSYRPGSTKDCWNALRDEFYL